MSSHLRYVIATVLLLATGYFSWRTYLYFFNTTTPTLSIIGMEDGQYYSQEVSATLKGSSPYKIATLSVWLDGKCVQQNFKINKKKFDYLIHYTTENMTNGEHAISFEIIDGTKACNKNTLKRTFYIDNQGLQATLTMPLQDCKVQQGRCLHVQFQANKPMITATVNALSGTFECFQKSKNSNCFEAFVPVECDQIVQEYPLSIEIKDHIENQLLLENTFQVVAVPFKKKILHVAPDRLKSELEFTPLQERDLEQALENITKNSGKEKLWVGAFDIPILMQGISTEFGVIRTSQERGRTVHKALDLTAEPKSVIWASNNGIIVLKERYTHSGNTIVIDHGCGIISMYFHLDDFADVQVGQRVKKGNPLGHMGMTGFANGQHLHWEIRVNNIAVDPMQWTQFTS
ncbi:M23 family metallopeptidase [Candidatus Dependentiae bacterium]|nr:M23 family metallopeptidase [Candidatus Dependentiae bacterium]